ncbi:unnamed protein product [Bursaphelenchus okinawaensis]|uniref:Phospholipid-transporting ATPase n=1 Tax=Bursaphelenchus okinawaensis TaxID=465554 RepID=A0A811KYG7_9BILA|nr:unnamed protein product [Bursaphelenchus okinawaensis]CAG9113053.1 unnamed protein product [Bursaphelenchus okinawaensis]
MEDTKGEADLPKRQRPSSLYLPFVRSFRSPSFLIKPSVGYISSTPPKRPSSRSPGWNVKMLDRMTRLWRRDVTQPSPSTHPTAPQIVTTDASGKQTKVDPNNGQHRKHKRQRTASDNSHFAMERVLRANDRDFNSRFKYADNYIKTSKYNLITFLPKNLFEQFQRLANFYFLVLMVLQLIPWISSIVWYSTAIPLAIVLGFSAAKDAYDDIQRHRSDSQVNNRISYVVRNGRLVEERWTNVKVGDIVRMENEHFIAADLLLLSSSEPHGLCYVETAELDGETNLKTRTALKQTRDMGDIVGDIFGFDGEIVCEPPNNKLDRFEGRLVYKGQQYPLSNNNMLLRGCRLRNTRWCYGLVIFAGRDTKLMMNSGKSKFKRTSLDRFLNILIMGIVLFLIAMCLICTVLCGVWEWVTGRHFTIYLEWETFVRDQGDRGSRQIATISFLMFFSYIILLNTVVPISLYVSVEIIRFVHSVWINSDLKMYYAKTDTPARARTTTLNEELGQVQYIFSDKTGTLTQNIMVFNKCSINGRSYGDLLDDRNEFVEITEATPTLDFKWNRWHESNFKFYDKTLLDDTQNRVAEVEEFWRLLAICHTVMPERKAGSTLEYQAQSPDEAALTSAARNFGFVFKSRTPDSITIEVGGQEERFEVLQILDFDNVRKRMSVIIRNNNGDLKMYCKGADTMILDRLRPDTNELLKSATMQHLDKFAADGLRTLCCAYKEIDADYCVEWMDREKQAQLDVANKNKKLFELYEEMEKDMTLLGATAIEDKLQDGVPETIANLAKANIKIWVLTGDKTETAINIGYSCKLLTEDMTEVFVVDGKDEKQVEVQLKDIKRRMDKYTHPRQPEPSYRLRWRFWRPRTRRSRSRPRAIAQPLGDDWMPENVKRYIQEQIRIVREAEEREAAEKREKQSRFYVRFSPSPNFAVKKLEKVDTITVDDDKESNDDDDKRSSIASDYDKADTVATDDETTEEVTDKVVGASSFYDDPKSPVSPVSGKVSPAVSPNGQQHNNVAFVPDSTDSIPHHPLTPHEPPNVLYDEATDISGGFGLVINGDSLAYALKRKFERLFLEVGCLCTAVICCRVTPLQKAQVVDLVKRHKKAVTLSIGDGANDVSMIKTAHIGVGISGQEGMQAVLSSDYSIGQFRYLERLLLVHGRWSYFRMCKFLRYFFYKNFSFTLTHFWYSFFCGYSAQTVYDPILIASYNMFFTALPVIAMGVFDQDVSEDYSVRFPKLYIPGQYNLFFNMRIFTYSVIHGMISSLVLFFVPYGAFYNSINHDGRDLESFNMLAFTIFTALVVVVTGQIMLDTSYWTGWNHFVIWGSLGFYILVIVLYYQLIPYSFISNGPTGNFYGVVYQAVITPHFWFSLLLICVILLLPVMLNRFFWFDTKPSYSDRLRVRSKLPLHERPEDGQPISQIKRTAATTRRSRRGSLRSGYAFSHTQGFGELIAKGTLFKNIENLRAPSYRSNTSPSPKEKPKSTMATIAEKPLSLASGFLNVPLLNRRGSKLHSKPPTPPETSQKSTTTESMVINNDKTEEKKSAVALQHNILVGVDSDPLPSNW